MTRSLAALILSLLLMGCGPSKQDLMRQQMLELKWQQEAQKLAQEEEAKRESRRQSRKATAHKAWVYQDYLTTEDVKALYSGALKSDDPKQTYFVELQLKPTEYDFSQNKQLFVIAGMRTLNNSSVYSPLFPDNSAEYRPGQKASSVVEFTLLKENQTNRLGQLVEKEDGTRWVAATTNFKEDSAKLETVQLSWSWEPGLFEDLSWSVPYEKVTALSKDRALAVQIGFRFCHLHRCKLEHQYLEHPIKAIKARVISILISNRATDKLIAEFFYEGQ